MRYPSESELPEVLAEIQRVAGARAMLALVDRYGGTDLEVPRQFDPAHPLVAVVGHEAAVAIVDHFAGERLYVARMEGLARQARNLEIRRRHDAGAPVRTLAREYRLSMRQIWTILGQTDPGREPQGDMFGGD